jgi:uncharacterized protein (TIRG00374 family)
MGQALSRWRPGRTARRLLWQGGVSALFVTLALRAVDLGGLRDAIESADLRWAPPALLLFTTAKYVDSWRWRYLLRGVRPLPQRALFGAFLIGNMVNNLLPLRAGDVAKVQVLGLRYGAPRASLAASVFVVEATLDGVVFLLFLAVSLAFFDLGDLPDAGIAALVVAAMAAFITALVLSRSPRAVGRVSDRLPARWRSTARSRLGDLYDGLHALRAWPRTLGAIALSVPAWLLEAGMFALFGRAFGLELGFPTFVAAMVAANLAVAVPVALWNFGPYETLVAGVLIAGGVAEATAISYALTVHLLGNLWIEATGLAAFAALGVSPRELFTLAAAPAGKSRCSL